MKVLQVNCVYKTGSTGKIVADIHTELLKNGHESIVCYGRGEKPNEPNVYKTCGEFYGKINALRSRLTGIMYAGCRISTHKLISIIKKEKPNVVHLHCLNGNFVNIFKLISWLKKSGTKTVLTLHAEFMHTANCGNALDCEKWKTGCGNCPRLKKETRSIFRDETHSSWKKMKKAFDGFNDNLVVASVSPWLMERAKQSPFLKDKRHVVVYNGLDTDAFRYYETKDLKEKHGITSEKIIFHATPKFNNQPNSVKGGYYVLQLAEKMKDENVKFFVAGNYDKSIDIPSNVRMLGRIENRQELARYYSMADITLLASRSETFSMICAESLCCGTPVVGFKAGAPEQISLPEYSEFVEYGNVEKLYNSVHKMLEKSLNKSEIFNIAKETYSKETMFEKYLSIYLR